MKNIFHFTTILLVFSFVAVNSVFGQMKPKIKKAEFLIEENVAFEVAWKNIKKGNSLFSINKPGAYLLALDHYKQSFEYNMDNAALNYRIGVCYLKVGPKTEALKFLSKAYSLNPMLTTDILYWLANAYQSSYDFPKAKKLFDEYLNSLDSRQRKKHEELVYRHLAECDNGQKMFQNPEDMLVVNLGSVNTIYNEYGPKVTESGMLFYTAKRDDDDAPINSYNYTYFEDIFQTMVYTDSAVAAFPMQGVNTLENNAIMHLSANGQTMYVYNGRQNNGDILVSNFVDSKWERAKNFSKFVSSNARETSLYITPDGKSMFFVSDRKKDSFGGKDIFYCRLDDNGKWEDPLNLGGMVNTPSDEESVFFHTATRTLYFSSKGHNTMGGYDVYKSVMDANGNWTKAVNLGYPVNSTGDDLGMVLNNRGNQGYYASSHSDSKGGLDLYWVYFVIPKPMIQSTEENLIAGLDQQVSSVSIEGQIEIKTIPLTTLKGLVIGKTLPLAKLDFKDIATNQITNSLQSDPNSGAYMAKLLPGKSFNITVTAPGFMYYTENIDIPASNTEQEIVKDINLTKIEPGIKVVLNNVFFDSGKSLIKPESYTELQGLKRFMDENPTVVIEVSGHTDNRGSSASNTALSRERAKACFDYLISLGVSQSRLVYKGVGSAEPLASNETEAGRSSNRRVEAKILKH